MAQEEEVSPRPYVEFTGWCYQFGSMRPELAVPMLPETARGCLSKWACDSGARFELGRQPANTKLSSNVTIRKVRCRGGNYKFRALRLDTGNFSWGSEVRRQLTLVHAVCQVAGLISLYVKLLG